MHAIALRVLRDVSVGEKQNNCFNKLEVISLSCHRERADGCYSGSSMEAPQSNDPESFQFMASYH